MICVENCRMYLQILFILFLTKNSFYSQNSLSVYAESDLTTFDINSELPLIATAFVQTGNELHYFSEVEYRENLVGEAPVKSGNDDESVLNNQLQFSPKELDFDEQATGIPQVQKVKVHNPTASTVRFDAISGSTIHFHCSFPEKKTIDPGEATFFEVIFLPRQEGKIDNVLFVHSSLGIFTYTIRGRGISNPYRTTPHIGAKIPMNGSFMSAIQVHNPYPNTLHITEIYSSGGNLHLEVPDIPHAISHESNLWKIKPYETKTVLNARLLGAQEMNVTSFVKIKTDISKQNKQYSHLDQSSPDVIENQEETIILPFQVEVTNMRGIFPAVSILDFGLIRAGERSAALTLEISSTLLKGIDIESLYVEQASEPNGIYMEFASKPPISLKSASKQIVTKPLAKIFFDSKLLRSHSKELPKFATYKGKIIAESRGGNYNISVPYVAVVYRGTLKQREDETAFYSKEKLPSSRSVTISNELPFDVAIWNVLLADNAKKSFSASLLSSVITLGSGQTRPVFLLKYISRENDGFESYCTLHTNVSAFRIPIIIFNGKLKVMLHSMKQNEFDFGLLGLSDTRSIQFVIINENPVAVTVQSLKKGFPSMTTLRLLGSQKGNGTVLTNIKHRNPDEIWQEGMDFTISANSFAVFQYTITVDSNYSVVQDSFLIETDFERMVFPVKFSVDEGQLVPVPDRISFSYAFPWRISVANLKVFSTFKRDMRVLRLSSLSRDPRIFFEPIGINVAPVIKSGKVSNIGKVMFKPSAACKDDCYLGMPLHTTDGQWFTYGMRLPQNLAEIDFYLYKKMKKKFLSLQNANLLKLNTTIMVDTEEVKSFPVNIHSELIWPRLLTRTSVRFPLTAVGNFTIVNLTLTNPSSLPVVVQLLPLVIYPDAEALVEFFRDELTEPLLDPVEVNETLMFSLRDTELFTLKRDSPVPKLRRKLESVIGSQIPKFTLSMLLEPGMNVRIRVGFLPSDYTLRSSLLLIRNNLTVIEPVVLYGCGARMDMQVDEKRARSKDPLLFVVTKDYLDDCNNPDRQLHRFLSTLTVKKHFVVRNTGEVPFTIVNMSLNNIPCENRGFRIMNCEPFRLKPNQTHTIEIAYTPDFLMDWNEAALQFYMHMNGTSWMFPLAASIPYQFLKDCSAALPRPAFESLIYYLCVSLLMLCLICILACSYLEGDRTVICALRQHYAVLDIVIESEAENLTSESEHDKSHFHIIRYSNDSNFYIKWFYGIANQILRPFSWFWRLRSDQLALSSPSQKVRRTKGGAAKVSNGEMLVKKTQVPAIPSTYRESSTDINAVHIEQPPHLQSETVNKRHPVKMQALKCKSVSPSTTVREKKNQERNTLEIVAGPDIQINHHLIKADNINNSPPKPKRKPAPPQNHLSQNIVNKSSERSSSILSKQNVTRAPEKKTACLGFITQSATYLPKQYKFESKSFSLENRNFPDSSHIIVESLENGNEKCFQAEGSEEIVDKVSLGSKIESKNESRHFRTSDISQDEKSEGGFSETNVTPEWADSSPINVSECDADEEFNAIVSATQDFCVSTSADSSLEDVRLYGSKKANSKRDRNVLLTYGHDSPNSSQSSKMRFSTNKNDSDSLMSDCASRSSSGSALDVNINAKATKGRKRFYRKISQKIERRNKPDGNRPSEFIEQLYRERKFAEKEYMKNRHENINKESVEVWPGFNLDLQSLNLFDVDSTLTSSANNFGNGIWQQPLQEQSWRYSNRDMAAKIQSPEEVTKAVKAFRLNPEAPPFISEKARISKEIKRSKTEQSTSSQSDDMASLQKIALDGPLGLSGSLFDAANIWSSTATTQAKKYDPNSPAMYWVDKILSDTSEEQ